MFKITHFLVPVWRMNGQLFDQSQLVSHLGLFEKENLNKKEIKLDECEFVHTGMMLERFMCTKQAG